MISIIVPIYNGEKYLKKCIDSILSQTYTQLEVILVDDGSSDGSLDICRHYEKSDKRIIVLHKENGGLSDARNAGLRIASGEYITFIDCDDYVHKDMLYIMCRELQKYNADFVTCGLIRLAEGDDVATDCKVDFTDVKVYNKDIALLHIHSDVNVTGPGKLYKRKLFDNLQYELGRYHEDEFMIHQLIYLCKRVVAIQNGYYFYVAHQNSIMADFSYKRLCDALDALTERLYFVKMHKWEAVFHFTVNTFFDYVMQSYRELPESGLKDWKTAQKLLRDRVKLLWKDKEIRSYMSFDARVFYISPEVYFKVEKWRKVKNRVKGAIKNIIGYHISC